MKGRNAQVARIYKLLTILENAPQGLSTAELTTRLHDRGFEIDKRTVYRDLDALRVAGFPLEERGKTSDQGTRWTLERSIKVTKALILNARELLALYLARSALTPLKETPFYSDLATTFGKIEDMLGKNNLEYLGEIAKDFYFEPGPKWGLGLEPDIIDTVRAACTEKQQLKMIYESVNSQKTSERTVGPHYLYFAKGSLYLVAEDLADQNVKTFAVPRIKEAVMLEDAYDGTIQEPEQLFSSSFGLFRTDQIEKVRIVFAPPLAKYVSERRWHDSQQIIQLKDGKIEMRMEVGMTPELVQWVLGFGASATVSQPTKLKESVQDQAECILKNYSTNKQAS